MKSNVIAFPVKQPLPEVLWHVQTQLKFEGSQCQMPQNWQFQNVPTSNKNCPK